MIRCIQEKDVDTCLSIYNWYILNTVVTFEEEPLSNAAFLSRVQSIIKKYPFIVLEEENEIVGYAYLDAFSPRSAYRKTVDLSIYLDHTKTNKGYGKQLMQAIIEQAKAYDFYTIVSIVTQGNLASEKIHESYGFQKECFLENVGYKFQTWLGVTYFLKAIHDFTK